VIYRWLDEIQEFRDKSARARRLRAEFLSDLRVKYALTPLLGEKRKIKNGEDEIEIGDNVQRSQLIVQTLSKVIGQLDPKVYGDKLAHTGADGGDIVLKTIVVQPDAKQDRERPPMRPEFDGLES
jgi:hypothetical protein